jgi:hypothetical protein
MALNAEYLRKIIHYGRAMLAYSKAAREAFGEFVRLV